MIFTKRFGSLFWTQFLGALNDNIFKNSIVLIALFHGLTLWGLPSEQVVAAAGGIFILPFFLFSALAGEIADKYEKAKLVQVTKWAEIFIMIIGSIGFFAASMNLLMITLFLMGTHSAFFGPMKYSMIPDLVSRDELVKANALVETGTVIAILIGTILGGFFAASPMANTYISLSIIIVAMLGLYASRQIPRQKHSNINLKISLNPIPVLKNNFKIISRQKVIFNTILAISWFWFLGAGILSVLPVYCKDYLKTNENVVTFFLALFTIGVSIGSILCEKISHKRVELGIVPIGALGISLFLTDLYLVTPEWLGSFSQALTLSQFISFGTAQRIAFDFLMMSIFCGIFIVPLYTLLQERSDSDERSRIIAGNNIVNAFMMVMSSLLLMLLYQLQLSTAEIFLIYAGLNLVVAIYIYSIVPEFTLRFYSWCLVHFIYKLKIVNLEKIPEQGPAILTCNHVSFVDWLLIAGACRRPVRFIMYYKFFDIPVAKILMKHAGVIPIAGAKEDPVILENAYNKIRHFLNDGELVCIFPEGHLTTDGYTHPFRPGILKILETTKVPVVPMALKGLWGGLFTKKKDGRRSLFRKTIELEVGDAISPTDFRLIELENKTKLMLGEKPVMIVSN
jgi:1-acyl-sn-glycerol-3-phosphate acyltransferase